MGTTYPPDGWEVQVGTWGTDVDQDATVSLSGPYSIKFEDTTPANDPYLIQEPYPTTPGTPVSVTTVVRADSTTGSDHVIAKVLWYDSADAYLSASTVFDAAVTASSTWEAKTAVITAPASAASYRVVIGKTKTAFNVWFDSVESGDFPIGFRAYRTSAQTFGTGASTKVQFDTENFDYGGAYDAATNHRFTAPIAGIYSVSANASSSLDTFTDGKVALLRIYKNGSFYSQEVRYASGTQTMALRVSEPAMLLDAGDQIEIYLYHDYGSDRTFCPDENNGSFSVVRVQ